MSLENEIKEQIEEFFERTCITDYIFKKDEQTNILRTKKKTPMGTWTINSVELGYFIDSNDQVVISILTNKEDEIHIIVEHILKARAKMGE